MALDALYHPPPNSMEHIAIRHTLQRKLDIALQLRLKKLSLYLNIPLLKYGHKFLNDTSNLP